MWIILRPHKNIYRSQEKPRALRKAGTRGEMFLETMLVLSVRPVLSDGRFLGLAHDHIQGQDADAQYDADD